MKIVIATSIGKCEFETIDEAVKFIEQTLACFNEGTFTIEWKGGDK